MTDRAARGTALGVLLLVAGVALAAWRMAPGLEAPFDTGFFGANAARYSIAGRNYDRHGFAAHLGAPDFTPGRRGDRPAALYLHHPPGAPLLVGLSFRLFGESERAATLPFFVVGLLALVVLFGLGRRCLGGAGGGAAAALAAATPMTAIYGGHVDPQGPLLTVFLLAAVWLHLRSRATGRRRDVAAAGAMIGLGLMVDWPAGAVALFCALLDRRGARAKRRATWLLPAVAAAFGAAYVGWMLLLGRSPVDDLLSAAKVRTAVPLVGQEEGRLLEAAAGAGSWFLDRMTPVLLVLAAAGLVPAVRRRAARPTGDLEVAVGVLGAAGVLHVVLFPQGALVHDYWTFLLLPPLALLAGGAVEALRAATARWGAGFQAATACAPVVAVAWWASGAASRVEEAGAATMREVDVGLARVVREQVRPSERVLTNIDRYNPVRSTLLVVPQFTYYADRALRGDVRTAEDLARAEAEEGPFDVYLHVPHGPAAPLPEELRRRGEPRVVEALGLRLEFFPLH